MVDRTGSTGNRRQDTALLAAIELARDLGRSGNGINLYLSLTNPRFPSREALLAASGSWSCENALAEALTRRDFGEVATMVILPSLGVFPSGSAPDARCRTVSGAFATGTKEYL
jgi:hypothetical protein